MKKLKIHISLDDTINIFENLYRENNKSIFENDTLNFLKFLHKKFSVCFSLFCFYQSTDGNFNLSKFSNKYYKEFKKHSKWLKFGFHSFDGNNLIKNNIEIYNKTLKELTRICSKDSITNNIRTHNFEGSLNFIKNIQKTEKPLNVLYTSEDFKRKNYYLSKKIINIIKDKHFYFDKNVNINFIKSDIRLENIKSPYNELIYLFNKQQSLIIIYTHEWKFFDENKIIKEKLYDICALAKKNHYK